MNRIAFVFNQPPHGHASGREGLDAVLATSAYSDQLAVFFMDDGVFQLVSNQQPSAVLAKDHASMFKLFELYDVENIYVLQQSLDERELNTARLIIPVVALSISEFHKTLAQYAIKLMF